MMVVRGSGVPHVVTVMLVVEGNWGPYSVTLMLVFVGGGGTYLVNIMLVVGGQWEAICCYPHVGGWGAVRYHSLLI